MLFTAPDGVWQGEILAFGLLQGNKLFIYMQEPRLDVAEDMNITIGNTKNSTNFPITLFSKKPHFGIYEFPTATYLPNEVFIKYKSKITNTAYEHRISGDLINVHHV